MTILPNGAKASLDIRKLKDYCLNASHPRGRHKARVFRKALGINVDDAAWLRDALLEAARDGEATHVATDSWGGHWRVDVSVTRHGKSAVITTVWLAPGDDDRPRFVTCWVL